MSFDSKRMVHRFKRGERIKVNDATPWDNNPAAWMEAKIVVRTAILTAEGHWHPVYEVEDQRGTRWIVGEGEMRPTEGGVRR